MSKLFFVIPAKAGTQERSRVGSEFRPRSSAPAFAGVTEVGR